MTPRFDVVVVGGGQAGLAIGYHLAQQQRRFTILEAADTPAAAWRERWDSLKLFTPVRYDSLPGLPFPGEPGHAIPGRDDVVAYLTDYARRFELPVELNSRVRAVQPNDRGGYRVELDDRTYETDQVVDRHGAVPGAAHPADGREPRSRRRPVPQHRVQVAEARSRPGRCSWSGGGNTGYQIAEELSRDHDVHLSIGSRQTPLPQRILGRDLFTLSRGGSADARHGGLAARPAAAAPRDADRLQPARRAAPARHPPPRPHRARAGPREVTFADGARVEPAAVIWATGFALDHSLVKAPVFDDTGRVVHRRGVTAAPGLYFLGLPWQHTRGSALLGWVKDDAAFIAERIAELADGRVARTGLAQEATVR